MFLCSLFKIMDGQRWWLRDFLPQKEKFSLPTPDSQSADPVVRALIEKDVGSPLQGSEEWIKQRGKYTVTASMAPAIVGENPNMSPETAFKIKAGIEQQTFSPYVQAMINYGTENEDRALLAYSRGHGQPDIFRFGVIGHPGIPWLAASPDGITGTARNVEAKCPVKRKIIPGEIPQHYYGQVQVQMQCFGLDVTDFVQWQRDPVTGEEIVDVTVVVRDDAWWSENFPKMEAFHNRLVAYRERHNNPEQQ